MHQKRFVGRKRKLGLGAIAVFAVVVAAIAPSWADEIIADGNPDDLTVAKTNLEMGEVCKTDGTDGYNGGNGQSVDLYLNRKDKATGEGESAKPERVWVDGTNVALTGTPGMAGIAVHIGSPGYITTPSGWSESSNNTTAGPLAATVTVKDLSLGVLGGSNKNITFEATGTSVAGTPWSADRKINVEVTVVDEATATEMDCTLPTASITNPVAPAPDYVKDSTQNAAYSCTDPERSGGGGVTPSDIPVGGCVGVVTPPVGSDVAVANGAALPTDQLGTYTLTVTPTDGVGNVGAPVSRTYTVVEPSSGDTWELMFERPVNQTNTDDDEVSLNNIKNGRVVPIKVNVFKNETEQLGDAGPVTIHLSVVKCPSGTGAEELIPDADFDAGLSNAGTNEFRWSETGEHWIYNLDTKAITTFLPVGTCLRIDVKQGGTLVSGDQWVIIKIVR